MSLETSGRGADGRAPTLDATTGNAGGAAVPSLDALLPADTARRAEDVGVSKVRIVYWFVYLRGREKSEAPR